MSRFARTLTGGIAAAVAMTTVLACTLPADAAMHRRHHRKVVRLKPAHLRPGYVGVAGYAGGAPGPMVPGLIDPAIGVVPPGVAFYGTTGMAGPGYGYGSGYGYGAGYGASNAGLLGGGGFLGTGAIPQTGIFAGVPVLGGFGL